MSDITQGFEEQKFGLEGVEASLGYEKMTPISPVRPPPEPPIETQRDYQILKGFEDIPGADKRGDDEQLGRESRPVDTVREYKNRDIDGHVLPENQTVSIEQAAHDLTIARNRDENSADLNERDALAREIDALRNGVTTESLGLEQQQPQDGPIALDDPAFFQLHVDEQQRRLEAAQAEYQKQQNDLQQTLQNNPTLLAAVSDRAAQAQAYENYAFNHYANGLIQNGRLIEAGFAARYGLQGIPQEQWATAITMLARSDPQKAQAIAADINATRNILAQSAQAEAAQQQRAAAQHQAAFHRDAAQHDQAYDQWSRNQGTSPDEQKAIYEEVMAEFRRQGWSDDQIAAAYNSNPAMRSLSGQIQMHQAAAYRLGEKLRQSARRKISHPVPHVVRPGSPVERQSDSDHYLKRLEKPGEPLTAKEAAAFVTARRNAARR